MANIEKHPSIAINLNPEPQPGIFISHKSVTVVTEEGESHTYPLIDVGEAIIALMESHNSELIQESEVGDDE